MEILGMFTSVWSDCTITTNAVLDTATNELNIEFSDIKMDDNSILYEEYFVDCNGNKYDNICPECHVHLTKTYMVEGVGKQLIEVTECPECGIL